MNAAPTTGSETTRTLDTAPLRAFATAARTQLLREVAARLTLVLSPGSQERVERPRAVKALERAVAAAGGGQEGEASVVDTVAYTWFNRIIALRFMDAHGYTGRGVVSPATGLAGQPEVLALAKRGEVDREVVPPQTATEVVALLSGTRQPRPGMDAESEAYALLLTSYCQYWHKAIPSMFEQGPDYTELLLPADILAATSVMSQAVSVLTPEVCEDVEVIGWLYQFYISERKDEVFAGFKKNKKAGAKEIPPATQLFTPHWIVKYLVENSVGRLWLLNHPESELASKMRYYITPVQEQDDFLRVESPEELTVIDPAAGSAHMLTYAFDRLYDIYEERGYQPSRIPGLILEKNLAGVEIDPRAGALAAFALTMKAASRRKLFLRNPVQPNITVLEPISFSEGELQYLLTQDGNAKKEREFWNQFEHADTFGSLIKPDAALTERLAAHLEVMGSGEHLLDDHVLERAQTVIRQAQVLSRQYCVVTANPPYMGSKQMNPLLSQFMKKSYPEASKDLYGAFIVRGMQFSGRGLCAMIVGDTWMAISGFEKLRRRILNSSSFSSFLHLHDSGNLPSNFGANAAFILDPSVPRDAAVPFIHLASAGPQRKRIDLELALDKRDQEHRFFLVPASGFEVVPGSPLTAYRLSEKMLKVFSSNVPLETVSDIRHGLSTGNNEVVVRNWWEVEWKDINISMRSIETLQETTAKWFPYNSGGQFRRWFGNVDRVLRYDQIGRDLMASFPGHRHDGASRFFSPSVSWSDISSGAPSFRYFPEGFIFSNKGNSIFAKSRELNQILAILNSECVTRLLAALSPTLTNNLGEVAKVPLPHLVCDDKLSHSSQLVRSSIEDWNSMETSWSFERNALVDIAGKLD